MLSFDENQLVIQLINSHNFHIKTLEKDRDKIELAIKEILNKKINVEFNIQEKEDEVNSKKVTKNTEHPLLIKAIETFDGEIIR